MVEPAGSFFQGFSWTLLNRLLKFLGTPLVGFADRISYPFSGETHTTVNTDNRVLQIHSGSRFIVIGDLSYKHHGAFHAYDKGALFQKLVARSAIDGLSSIFIVPTISRSVGVDKPKSSPISSSRA